MASPFASPEEFRDVIDRLFQMMSEDAEMGPRLREADVPRRLQFEDVDLVLNVRPGQAGEQANLRWVWTDDKPIYERYRTLLDREYPQLKV